MLADTDVSAEILRIPKKTLTWFKLKYTLY